MMTLVIVRVRAARAVLVTVQLRLTGLLTVTVTTPPASQSPLKVAV